MNPSMQIELSLGLCTHHTWFCRKIVNTDVVSTSFVNGIILCICTYYYNDDLLLESGIILYLLENLLHKLCLKIPI